MSKKGPKTAKIWVVESHKIQFLRERAIKNPLKFLIMTSLFDAQTDGRRKNYCELLWLIFWEEFNAKIVGGKKFFSLNWTAKKGIVESHFFLKKHISITIIFAI